MLHGAHDTGSRLLSQVGGGVTVILGDNRGLNRDEETVLGELEARGFAKLVKVQPSACGRVGGSIGVYCCRSRD